MAYKQDWFMRQLQSWVQFVARILFHKDTVQYEIVDEQRLSQTDLFYQEILRLLQSGNICAAEDLLFAQFEPGNELHLQIALEFYQRLSLLDDESLEAGNFSREEIAQGLKDILYQNQITIDGLE